MRRAFPHILAAAAYAALALQTAYPLWMDPSLKIIGMSDPLLNAYILDWVQYALFHRLGEFHQANYFWPHADSLAYGELLISPAILALPFRPFTASAVALHNLSLVQAFFFSALAAHGLAWRLLRSKTAAWAAGLIYGFGLHRVAQTGHLQLVHGEFLPLAVLGLEAFLETRRRRWAALAAGAALAQALTSWYWAVFTLAFMVPYGAVRLWQSRRSIRPGDFAVLAAAAALAVLLAIPPAWPSIQLKRKNALFRPPDAAKGFSATPADFLVPAPRSLPYAGRLPAGDGSPEQEERRLFPGFVPAAALLWAAGATFRPRKGSAGLPARPGGETEGPASPFPIRLWIILTFGLLSLCFGPALEWKAGGPSLFPMPGAIAGRLLPMADSMRVPARWILPAALGLSILTAAAAARLVRATPAKWAPLAAVLALWAAAAETLVLPVPFQTAATVPEPKSDQEAIYAEVDKLPWPSPVLELPILPEDDNRQLIQATWHRRPMINGSNGFFPPGFRADMKSLLDLPSPASLETLRRLGPGAVVINGALRKGKDPGWPEERVRRLVEALGPGALVYKPRPASSWTLIVLPETSAP